jgi:hypothetical protein
MTDSLGNTWDSYGFIGFAEMFPPYDSPPLYTAPGESPIHGLTYVVHVRDDLDLEGQTITDAIGYGFECGPLSGPPNCGDPWDVSHLYYVPGDANMYSGQWPAVVTGEDVTYLANYFKGFQTNQPCIIDDIFAAADINGDCLVIGSDVTRLVNYFRGMNDIVFCPETPSSWSSDDIPDDAPDGWPNCE